MALPPVIGQIRLDLSDNLLEGWCWAPEQPDARQVVEIYIDDQFIVAMVAGWLDLRLQHSRIGDGRHGFALTLPPTDDWSIHVVSARARPSGYEFARIQGDEVVTFEPFAARIDALAGAIPQLTETVDAVAEETDSNATVNPAMERLQPWRQLGERLIERSRTRSRARSSAATIPLGVARQRLAAEYGTLCLPAVRRPRTSIVLQADTALAAARTIAGIAPALAELRAEVILIDAGGDPLASLLPSLIRNLRCLHDRNAVTPCGAGNLGAAEARGEMLIFLDTGAPSPTALVEMTKSVGHGEGLAVGQRLLEPLRRFGRSDLLTDQTIRTGNTPLGLRVCVSQGLFTALGRFDNALTNSPGLECADLFLRAMLLGARTEIWREPSPNEPMQASLPRQGGALDAKQMVDSLAVFRMRWQGSVPAQEIH